MASRRDDGITKGEAPTTKRAAVKVTRDGLMDGSLLAYARARIAGAKIDLNLRSDAEIETAVEQTLSSRPDTPDLWVFSYGSLMWNPTFLYAERRKATLHNWQRKYCAWSPVGRGTPECPMLVLALEIGGLTEGIAYRLPPGEERTELALIFRREMFTDDYVARWVIVNTGDGPRQAVAFVVNSDSKRYAGSLMEEKIVAVLSTARGELGTSADYLRETVAHLDELGLRDEALARINLLVQARLVQERP
jgi:glutathione-specific gamma-glutamylcyclotransferase